MIENHKIRFEFASYFLTDKQKIGGKFNIYIIFWGRRISNDFKGETINYVDKQVGGGVT